MSPAEKFVKKISSRLWEDRKRVASAGLAAVVLWLLLGEKVQDELSKELEIQVIESGAIPLGEGLFIQVPDNLALSAVTPQTAVLEMEGPRDEIARLEGLMRGFYEVSRDFTGGRQRRSVQVDVAERFDFPQLRSLGVTIKNDPVIELALAQRAYHNVSLTKQNLVFDDASIAEGLAVNFSPSLVRVSGPIDRVQLLVQDPGLFALTRIDADAYRDALDGALTVRTRNGSFGDGEGNLQRLTVTDPNELIRISFQKAREYWTVTLEDVEVLHLVPARANREDVRDENPLTFVPDAVSVAVTVPRDLYPSEEAAREELRKALNLFVDLGDMLFGSDAAKLIVRNEGLPPDCDVVITPPEIDVNWNPRESVAEELESDGE